MRMAASKCSLASFTLFIAQYVHPGKRQHKCSSQGSEMDLSSSSGMRAAPH